MGTILLPRVKQFLDANGIEHKEFNCDPDLADTASFCEHYGFKFEQAANTIIVASKTEPVKYACCVVLATCKLDVNNKVCKLLEARKASFAPMEQALKLSGMEYGGVTAFGLPNDIPILIDSMVMDCNEIVMGGGNRTSKVLLDPKELVKIPNAKVIDNLAKDKEI
jgi:Cys-tRNA(Pro) deacylase